MAPTACEPVLVTRRLPQEVLARIAGACDLDLWQGTGAMPRGELLRHAAGKTGLVTLLTDRIDEELLAAAGPDLRIVANYAVGYDNIDVAACSARGILVANTPDVLTETSADMAWALMLAATRRICEGDRLVRSGQPWFWDPGMLLGWDLHHKVLGLVGFGRIGQAVARRAQGFGMRVVYASRRAAPAEIEREVGVQRVPLADLLADADFVSLHVPLTPETRHLISADELRRMKPGAVLVNTSRGAVVDEAALAAALGAGEIFAAGLDVYEREPEVLPALLSLPNVVLAPHLGSASIETRLAMGMMAADNLLAALSGRRPPTLVNPEVWDARSHAEPR